MSTDSFAGGHSHQVVQHRFKVPLTLTIALNNLVQEKVRKGKLSSSFSSVHPPPLLISKESSSGLHCVHLFPVWPAGLLQARDPECSPEVSTVKHLHVCHFPKHPSSRKPSLACLCFLRPIYTQCTKILLTFVKCRTQPF